MKRFCLLLCWFCSFGAGIVFTAEGQINHMEETKNGRMYFVFRSEMGDSTVTASSDQLMSIFNYQDVGIKFMVNLSSFQSDHSRLDSFLKSIEPPHFQFRAHMKMTWLNARQNQMNFPLEGTMEFNQISRYVKMEADLYRVSNTNQVRAQLRLRKQFYLDELGLKDNFPGFNEECYIELYQPLMKPDRLNNL